MLYITLQVQRRESETLQHRLSWCCMRLRREASDMDIACRIEREHSVSAHRAKREAAPAEGAGRHAMCCQKAVRCCACKNIDRLLPDHQRLPLVYQLPRNRGHLNFPQGSETIVLKSCRARCRSPHPAQIRIHRMRFPSSDPSTCTQIEIGDCHGSWTYSHPQLR